MKRVALWLLAATAIGCASIGRAVFREPVVSYRDAMITGLGLTGGNLEVVLSIYNPNSFRLDGTALTYSIAVDSVPFGTGSLSDRFTVQEGDSTLVRLPLAFSYAGVGQAGRQLIQTGSVNYTVSGDITVGTPIGSFTRPYSGRGRLTTIR
jgi:LEA14-like dessication related protein